MARRRCGGEFEFRIVGCFAAERREEPTRGSEFRRRSQSARQDRRAEPDGHRSTPCGRVANGFAPRGHVLRALIDEELLVQRAHALGLVDTDPSLRRALVIAMKEKVLSALPAPTAEEIEAFYGSHSEEYRRPLDEVEPRVLRDFERARRQEALDKYLADQRSKVSIERFLGSTGTEAKPESEPEP